MGKTKLHCCYMEDGQGCQQDATLEVRSNDATIPYHEDYTHSCHKHLPEMLCEGVSLVYPVEQ